MRNKFLLAVLAAAAVTTSCQKDDLDVASSLDYDSAEKANVSFAIGVEEAQATKALSSDASGWQNYVDNLMGDLDHRLTLQVFAKSTEGILMADPMVTQVQTFTPSSSAEANKTMTMDDVALPVGQEYTAVVWVDFVTEGTDADLWYDTENLTQVGVKNTTNGLVGGDYTLESRDAYTTFLDFTVESDGTWAITSDYAEAELEDEEDKAYEDLVDGEEASTFIAMTATRPFSKVRVVLNDYSKSEWEQYFGENATSRTIDYTALTVKQTPTTFNAVTSEASNLKDLTYHSSWSDSDIKWVDATTYATDGNGDLPVIDMNYIFPVTAANDNSANGISVQMLDMDGDYSDAWVGSSASAVGSTGTVVVAYYSFATIPVVTNKITTIVGSFLTENYNFEVIVSDGFDSNSSTVEVEDDGASTTTQIFNIASGYQVITKRASDESLVSVQVADVIAADDAATVITEVSELNGVGVANASVYLSFASDVTELDFDELSAAAYIEISVASGATITNLNSAAALIYVPNSGSGTVSVSDSSANIEITNDNSLLTKTTTTYYGLSISTTGTATILDGSYAEITITASSITLGESVKASGATTLTSTSGDITVGSSGSYAGAFTAMSAADITVNNSNYFYSTVMLAATEDIEARGQYRSEGNGVTLATGEGNAEYAVGTFHAMTYTGDITIMNFISDGTVTLLSGKDINVYSGTFNNTGEISTIADTDYSAGAFNAYAAGDLTITSATVAGASVIASAGDATVAGSFTGKIVANVADVASFTSTSAFEFDYSSFADVTIVTEATEGDAIVFSSSTVSGDADLQAPAGEVDLNSSTFNGNTSLYAVSEGYITIDGLTTFAADKELTFTTDGALAATSAMAGYSNYLNLVSTAGSVTATSLEFVNLTANGYDGVTLSGVTVTGATDLYSEAGLTIINKDDSDKVSILGDLTIDSKQIKIKGSSVVTGIIDLDASKYITINNATLTSGGNAMDLNAGTSLTITGSTLSSGTYSMGLNAGTDLTITDSEINSGISGDGYNVTYLNSNGTVTLSGATFNAYPRVGDTSTDYNPTSLVIKDGTIFNHTAASLVDTSFDNSIVAESKILYIGSPATLTITGTANDGFAGTIQVNSGGSYTMDSTASGYSKNANTTESSVTESVQITRSLD